jgi:hypothetical protein
MEGSGVTHSYGPTETEKLRRERDNWIATAEQEGRNTQYYRGLLMSIGEMLGDEAKTCDDGSMADSVLCAKIPDLVRRRLLGTANASDPANPG